MPSNSPTRPAPPKRDPAAEWGAETARRDALLAQMGYKAKAPPEKPKPKTPMEFILHLLGGGSLN